MVQCRLSPPIFKVIARCKYFFLMGITSCALNLEQINFQNVVLTGNAVHQGYSYMRFPWRKTPKIICILFFHFLLCNFWSLVTRLQYVCKALSKSRQNDWRIFYCSTCTKFQTSTQAFWNSWPQHLVNLITVLININMLFTFYTRILNDKGYRFKE